MPLGRQSKLRLATCDPRLQQLVTAVAAKVDAGALLPLVSDISVACGYRGEAEQNDAYRRGASKTPWPRSKHNKVPALAVDLWPYPLPDVDKDGKVDWDAPAWAAVRKLVLATAHELSIPIHVISWDLPHFQLA